MRVTIGYQPRLKNFINRCVALPRTCVLWGGLWGPNKRWVTCQAYQQKLDDREAVDIGVQVMTKQDDFIRALRIMFQTWVD